MKKIISIALVVVASLSFILAGCKSNEPSAPSATKTVTSTGTITNTPTITETPTITNTTTITNTPTETLTSTDTYTVTETPTTTNTATITNTPTTTPTVTVTWTPMGIDRQLASDANTLGLWHCNETAGQTISDSSSFGRMLTLGNTTNVETADPIYAASDRDGFWNCIYFDGANFQYIRRVETLTLATNSFTVEFWIKLVPTNAYMHMFNTDSVDAFLALQSNSGLSGAVADSNWSTSVQSTAVVDDNAWHYVAYVYDYAATTLSIYVDGTLSASNTSINKAVGAFNSFYFGGRPFNTFMTGWMDEIRISNIARSSTEIANYYTQATQ